MTQSLLPFVFLSIALFIVVTLIKIYRFLKTNFYNFYAFEDDQKSKFSAILVSQYNARKRDEKILRRVNVNTKEITNLQNLIKEVKTEQSEIKKLYRTLDNEVRSCVNTGKEIKSGQNSMLTLLKKYTKVYEIFSSAVSKASEGGIKLGGKK